MRFNPLSVWYFSLCIDSPFNQAYIYISILDILDNKESNHNYFNIALKQLLQLDDFYICYALPQILLNLEESEHDIVESDTVKRYFSEVFDNIPLKNRLNFKLLNNNFNSKNCDSAFKRLHNCALKIERKEASREDIPYRNTVIYNEYSALLAYINHFINQSYGKILLEQLQDELEEQNEEKSNVIGDLLKNALNHNYGRLSYLLAANIFRTISPESCKKEILDPLSKASNFPNLLLEPDLLCLLFQTKFFTNSDEEPEVDNRGILEDEFYNLTLFSTYRESRKFSARRPIFRKIDHAPYQVFESEEEVSSIIEITFWQAQLLYEFASQKPNSSIREFCNFLVAPDLNQIFHRKNKQKKYAYYDLLLKLKKRGSQLFPFKRDEQHLSITESKKVIFSPIPAIKLVEEYQRKNKYITIARTADWYENHQDSLLYLRLGLFGLVGFQFLQNAFEVENDLKKQIITLFAYEHSFGFAYKNEFQLNDVDAYNLMVERQAEKKLRKRIEDELIHDHIYQNRQLYNQLNNSRNLSQNEKRRKRKELNDKQRKEKENQFKTQFASLKFEEKKTISENIPLPLISIQKFINRKLKQITKSKFVSPDDIYTLFKENRDGKRSVTNEYSQTSLFYKVIYPQVVFGWIEDTYPGISDKNDIGNQYLNFLAPIFTHLTELTLGNSNTSFLKPLNRIHKAVAIDSLFPNTIPESFNGLFFEDFRTNYRASYKNKNFKITHRTSMLSKEPTLDKWKDKDFWEIIKEQENSVPFFLVRSIEILKLLGENNFIAQYGLNTCQDLKEEFKKEFKKILSNISNNSKLGRYVRLRLIQILDEEIFLDWEEGQELIIDSLFEFGSVYEISLLVNNYFRQNEEFELIDSNLQTSFQLLLLKALFIINEISKKDKNELLDPHEEYYNSKKGEYAQKVLLAIAYSIWKKRKNEAFDNYLFDEFKSIYKIREENLSNKFSYKSAQFNSTEKPEVLKKVFLPLVKSLNFNQNSKKTTAYYSEYDTGKVINLFGEKKIDHFGKKRNTITVLGHIINKSEAPICDEVILDIGIADSIKYSSNQKLPFSIGDIVSVKINRDFEVKAIEKLPLVDNDDSFGNSKSYASKNWFDPSEIDAELKHEFDNVDTTYWFIDYVNFEKPSIASKDYYVKAISIENQWVPKPKYFLELLSIAELSDKFYYRLVLLEQKYFDSHTSEEGFLFSLKPGINYFIKESQISEQSVSEINKVIDSTSDPRGLIILFEPIFEDDMVVLSLPEALDDQKKINSIDMTNINIRNAFEIQKYVEAKRENNSWVIDSPDSIKEIFTAKIQCEIEGVIGTYSNLSFQILGWNPITRIIKGKYKNIDSFDLNDDNGDLSSYFEAYTNLKEGDIVSLKKVEATNLVQNSLVSLSKSFITIDSPLSSLTLLPINKFQLNNLNVDGRKAFIEKIDSESVDFTFSTPLPVPLHEKINSFSIKGIVKERNPNYVFTFSPLSYDTNPFQLQIDKSDKLHLIKPGCFFEIKKPSSQKGPKITIINKKFNARLLWAIQSMDYKEKVENEKDLKVVGVDDNTVSGMTLYYELKLSGVFTGLIYELNLAEYEINEHQISFPPKNYNSWFLMKNNDFNLKLKSDAQIIPISLINKGIYLLGELDLDDYSKDKTCLNNSIIEKVEKLEAGLFNIKRKFLLDTPPKRLLDSKKYPSKKGDKSSVKTKIEYTNSLKKFEKFIAYFDLPFSERPNLLVEYPDPWTNYVKLIDFEVPINFNLNRNYDEKEIQNFSWTSKIDLLSYTHRQYSPHPPYRYFNKGKEGKVEGFVKLIDSRGEVFCSSIIVKPFNLYSFYRYCKESKIKHNDLRYTFIGIYDEASRFRFDLKVEHHNPVALFEFGFGKLIAIPTNFVFYRNTPISKLSNVIFHGDEITKIVVNPSGTSKRFQFRRIEFCKTTQLYNDAKKDQLIHVLYIDAKDHKIKMIMEKKANGFAVEFKRKLKQAKLSDESKKYLKENYDKNQYKSGEIVLYGRLNSEYFKNTNGLEVIFNLTDIKSSNRSLNGKSAFFMAENIYKKNNEYSLLIRPIGLDNNSTFFGDDFLNSCYIDRRDFSANSYTLIKYYEESDAPNKTIDGVDTLKGTILLVKLFLDPFTGKYRFSLLGKRRLLKNSFTMPFRSHVLLNQYFKAYSNENLYGVIVTRLESQHKDNPYYVIEIKPGLFVRLPCDLITNNHFEFKYGDIIRIITAHTNRNKTYYTLLLAKSSDLRFFNSLRIASILPKNNVKNILNPIVNKNLNELWYRDRYFTVNEFPNVEVYVDLPGNFHEDKIYIQKFEKLLNTQNKLAVIKDEILAMEINAFELNSIPGKISISTKYQIALITIFTSEKFFIDWRFCTFQEQPISKVLETINIEKWKYLDDSTTSFNKGKWEEVQLREMSPRTGPLYAEGNGDMLKLRYSQKNLPKFGLPTDVLFNSIKKRGNKAWYTVVHAEKIKDNSNKLWIEICPGRVVEILSELLIVSNTNFTFNQFFWDVFSPGDRLELKLIQDKSDVYKEDQIELIKWHSSPRKSFGYKAYLPVKRCKQCLEIGAGNFRFKIPFLGKWQDKMIGISSNNELSVVKKNSFPEMGSVVFLSSVEDKFVIIGFEDYEIFSINDENYWNGDSLENWLSDIEMSPEKGLELLQIVRNYLPITVEEIDEPNKKIYFSRRHQITSPISSYNCFTKCIVLGFLDNDTFLLKSGNELIPFEISKISNYLPVEIIHKAFRFIIRRELNVFYIHNVEGEWHHGLIKSDTGSIKCRFINYVDQEGFYGILCLALYSKEIFYIPYEECCWISPPENTSKINVLKKIFENTENHHFDAWLDRTNTKISVINIKEARDEFRKLFINKKISISIINYLCDIEGDDNYGYCIARSNSSGTYLLVEVEKTSRIRDLEHYSRNRGKNAKPKSTSIRISSLAEVIMISEIPHRNIKVATGEPRYFLDLPALSLVQHSYRKNQYRSYYSIKNTNEEWRNELIDTLSSTKIDVLRMNSIVYKMSKDFISEDQLVPIISQFQLYFKELINSKKILVGDALLFLLAINNIISHPSIIENDKSLLISMSIHLLRDLGMRALRSLHVEIMVSDWLGDKTKREDDEGLWSRLNEIGKSLFYKESDKGIISYINLIELMNFCIVAIPLRSRKKFLEFTPIRDALLVSVGKQPIKILSEYSAPANETLVRLMNNLPLRSKLPLHYLYGYINFDAVENLLNKFMVEKADFFLLENILNNDTI